MKRFPGTRVYVTGATGFIGGTIARRFVDEGARVTALVRPRTDASALEALGVTVVRGDVTDPATLDLRGQDLVVHAAAWVGFGVPRGKQELFWRTNVGGTQNVVEAARRADVPKLVHVSSIAALGRNRVRADRPATEQDFDPAPREFSTLYERTKVEAHRVVLESGLHAALAMPGLVLGRGGPFERLLSWYVNGDLPALPKGDAQKGWVHVDDVAEGVLLMALKGKGPYLLVDDNVMLSEMLARLSHVVDVPVQKRRVGIGTLKAGAAVVEALYHLVGRAPPVSRELVRGLPEPSRYDSSRVVEELGWRPRMWERLADDVRALKKPTRKELKAKAKAERRRAREEKARAKAEAKARKV